MSKISLSLFGIVIATIFSMTRFIQSGVAEPVTMDINKANEPGPGFGTDKLGTLTIDSNNNTLDVSANLIVTPKQGKVFEGWLVQADGSNYKLSLGVIEVSNLKFSENMVNPYTYIQFIITEEPNGDADPNAVGTYGELNYSLLLGNN